MNKYRTKPCEIEAIQWTGLNLHEIKEFIGKDLHYEVDDHLWEIAPPIVTITIHTLEGDMIASKGDYIIKGLKGEFYPCKPDVFEKKYEQIIEGEKE